MRKASNRRRQPRVINPCRWGKSELEGLMRVPTTGLIAFRLGTADHEHYHMVACSILLATKCIELVAKHRHLLDALEPTLDALHAVHDRDGWTATEEELQHMEAGIEIYQAIVRTTPGEQFRRAMLRAYEH